MRRKAMHGLAHLGAAVLGLSAVLLLLTKATPEVGTHAPRILILHSGCWVAQPRAYNNPAKGVDDYWDPAVSLTNLLNFVWCNEYSGAQEPAFSFMGEGGHYLDGHLVTMYQAVKCPGVATILYTCGPGMLASFVYPRDVLDLKITLEQIRSEYPETAKDVDTYLEALDHSGGYADAVKEFGRNWRQTLPRSSLLQLKCPTLLDEEADNSVSFASNTRRSATRLLTVKDWALDRLSLLPRSHPAGTLAEPVEINRSILRILDECAALYREPLNDVYFRRMMLKENFWVSVGGDAVWQAWANIMARMCKARGLTLVIYVAPHLHVTTEEYRSAFRPWFVDRVRQTFAAHDNVIVIDQANDKFQNQLDCSWFNQRNVMRIKPGYLFNAIGRLKLSRHIIQELLSRKLIGVRGYAPRYLGSAWPGEHFLPEVPLQIKLAPEQFRYAIEDPILDDEERYRSSRVIDGQQVQAARP